MRLSKIFAAVLCTLFINGCGNSPGATGNSTATAARDARIVNGTLIDQDELPFVRKMRVQLSDGRSYLCSGSFISPHHFLTAAHCLFEPGVGQFPLESISVEKEPDNFVPAAGIATNPAYTGAIAQTSVSASLYYFPADIGIILIADTYEGDTVPVSTILPVAGQQSLIAGFGTTASADPGDGLLRAGLTTIEFVDQADGVIYWSFDSLAESNTCYGDSGGPQLVRFEEDGPLVLVGVTSGGYPNCEPGSLSFNTLVANHLDFLNLVTGGDYNLK